MQKYNFRLHVRRHNLFLYRSFSSLLLVRPFRSFPPLLKLSCFNRGHFYFLSLFFALILGGCSAQTEQKLWPDKDRMKIVSTTEMVHALVSSIGGEQFQYQVLIQGELDPHSYQLVKGVGEKLESCDAIFASGLGLEHGPSLRKFLETSEKTRFLGDQIFISDPNSILYVEGQIDPHLWMDPSLFVRSAYAIAQRFSELLPENREIFMQRAQRLTHYTLTVHDALHARLLTVPEEKRVLVTSHDAFHYFVRAYFYPKNEVITLQELESRIMAAEGLAPESQISVAQIARVADFIVDKEVRVLFTEANVNRDAVQKIASVLHYRGRDVVIAACPLYGDSMPPLEDLCPKEQGKEERSQAGSVRCLVWPSPCIELLSAHTAHDSSPVKAKLVGHRLEWVEESMQQDPYEPRAQFLHYIAMMVHNVETIRHHLLQ